MKQKAFFIFKGLSLNQIKRYVLESETPTLKLKNEDKCFDYIFTFPLS